MEGGTKLLYLDDSYIRVFEASVVDVRDGGVILDRTAFHPTGGGLESDRGKLSFGGSEAKVVEARMAPPWVIHVLDGGMPERGALVEGVLDWERRYRIMRLHTAIHVLSAVMMEKTSALITGNNVSPEMARVDFSLERFDRATMEECVEESNRLMAQGREVKTYYMEWERALKTPGMVKLASKLPPDIPVLRVVEIEGVDIQADGGPHVRNTAEVGGVRLVKLENKGRANRRIYLSLV
ncbi:Alanine--tRNA ligase [archaeon HR01]|nr:Alanine--tRNA ligase [archaeon HR01]